MAITKEKKASLVQEYVSLLDDSYAVVMIQLLGLTVAEVTDLRTKIREAGGKYGVVKNTLFRLALAQRNMPVPEAITGPIAVAFCPEDIAPVVTVVEDFAKGLGDRPFEIVAGIVENDVLDAKAAKALASLPTKNTLFAQILAGLNAPSSQVVGVMAGGIRQVLNVLQARVDQLQEVEAAA